MVPGKKAKKIQNLSQKTKTILNPFIIVSPAWFNYDCPLFPFNFFWWKRWSRDLWGWCQTLGDLKQPKLLCLWVENPGEHEIPRIPFQNQQLVKQGKVEGQCGLLPRKTVVVACILRSATRDSTAMPNSSASLTPAKRMRAAANVSPRVSALQMANAQSVVLDMWRHWTICASHSRAWQDLGLGRLA